MLIRSESTLKSVKHISEQSRRVDCGLLYGRSLNIIVAYREKSFKIDWLSKNEGKSHFIMIQQVGNTIVVFYSINLFELALSLDGGGIFVALRGGRRDFLSRSLKPDEILD